MTTSPLKSLFATVFKVSLLSGLTAALSFGWNLLVASHLGVSGAADAFFVASTVPAVLISLCSSIGTALVPVFIPASRPVTDANNLYVTVFNAILLALLAVVVLGTLFAPTLVAAIGPGVDNATMQLATVLLRILLPTAFFSGLAALLTGMLNAHERFTYAALSNLVRAASTLGGMALLSAYGTVGMSVGWVLGGLIQLIVTVGVCRWQKVFWYRFRLDRRVPALGDAWTLARTALLGMGAVQAVFTLERAFGSFLPVGTISALSYATRTARVGGGLVVQVVGQVSLPALAAKNAQESLDDAHCLFIRNLRLMVYLTFPLAAVLIGLSLPLSTLLFQHGAIAETQVSRIATLLSLASIGLFFFGLYELSLVCLYAWRRIKAISLFYAILLGGFVMWGGLIGQYEAGKGLALAYPLSLLMSALYGLWALKIPRSYWATTMTYIARLAVVTLVTGISAFSVATILTPMLEALPAVARAGLILSAGLVSAGVVWVGMTAMLRIPETLSGLQRVRVWVHFRL